MNTNFKHKILAGTFLFSALFMFSSCDDKESMEGAPGETLYEVMASDTELEDFLAVVNACGEHCADSLFNKSRVYTVWAPKDETFNKDSLIQEVADGNRDEVFKRFVLAHVANHMRAANGTIDAKKVMLLNGKLATFDGSRNNGYTFDGKSIEVANVRAWNGILHKLSTPSEYKYNIWEYLRVADRTDSVASFLYEYEVTEFSPSSSVIGPIVNGEQTYLDSVFTTSNVLLSTWEGVGRLNVEDSTYTVYVPTNEVWNETKALAYKHYNYNLKAGPASMDSLVRDSLRNFYSSINVIKYMTYSDNEQRYIKDTVNCAMPSWQGRSVFVGRPEFEKARLEANVIESFKMSNGTFKIVDKLPYSEFELWHDTIKLEGENVGMRDSELSSMGVEGVMYVSKSDIEKFPELEGTEISGGAYQQYYSENASVEVRYRLPDVLAASYQVALIIVPDGFPRVKEDAYKTRLNVKITQNGSALFEMGDDEGYENDPTRIDTIFLKDANGDTAVVNIPYCEYYRTSRLKDYNTEILIKTLRKGKNLDKSLRLDAILLVPVKDTEE